MQERQAYANKHELHKLFVVSVQALLKEKPANVEQFLSRYFSSQSKTQGTKSNEASTSAAKAAPSDEKTPAAAASDEKTPDTPIKAASTLDEFWAQIDTDNSGSLTAGEVWKAVKAGLFDHIEGFKGMKSGEIMDLLDTDEGEDSYVTKAEFSKAMVGVFQKRFPGVPPPPSLGPAVKAAGTPEAPPTNLEEFWARIDKDNSGSLTAGEVWKAVKEGLFDNVEGFKGMKSGEIMDLLDTDEGEDSYVTKAEFSKAMVGVFQKRFPGVPPPPALGPGVQAASGGPVKAAHTLDEFWAQIDTDKSGSLTAGEVWKAVKAGLFDHIDEFRGLKSGEIMDLLDTDEGEDAHVTKTEFLNWLVERLHM